MTIPTSMVIDSFRDSFSGNFYFLSNMYPLSTPIWHQRIGYNTSEHLFVALKSLDSNVRHHIAIQKDGFAAKRAGKRIVLRPGYNEIRPALMKYVTRRKYCDPTLAEMLVRTEPATLIEGNKHHDNYWGTCICENCKYKPGLNLLGQILMKVRTELIFVG